MARLGLLEWNGTQYPCRHRRQAILNILLSQISWRDCGMYLTEQQVAEYHRDGFLVLENFWNEDTVHKLRSRIADIIEKADLSAVQTIFSTKDQMRATDDYFLTSGREIRFFWEEKARDSSGLINLSKDKAINKIGHGLHDLDEEFENVSYEQRIGFIARELGQKKPMAVQSMYIFKQANIGGEVCPHQDGSFLYTEPQSCLGFWWALDDCSKENGCLWAVPGSHKLGVKRRFRRKDPPQEGLEFVPEEKDNWDLTGAIPLIIPRGSLVLLHSALVHFSNENLSDKARHAYSIHVVDGSEGFSYPADNWLQRPADHPFREIILTEASS